MSIRRARCVVTAAALLVVLGSGPAWADEGEESDESAVLVLQAIALLANENSPDVVLERIEDAVEAPMTEGADLERVERAADVLSPLAGAGAVPADVEEQVRVLLEGSIGVDELVAPAAMVTGAETGTTVVLPEFRPARGVADGGDAALLLFAALATVGGLFAARRLRPRHSLRELRRASPATAVKKASA